jgi:hypothetical protein
MKIRNKSTLQGPVSILYFFIDCLSAVRICVRGLFIHARNHHEPYVSSAATKKNNGGVLYVSSEIL